jgi:archaellum component FlaC
MTDEVVNTPSVEPAGSPVSESVSEAPDTPVLSVEEYSDYRVPVKLDGEELQVPLSEAIAGYQRQADYTRKTQELSQQRQQFEFATALEAALQRDPAATIDMLSRHYGLSRQAVTDMVDNGESFEDLDPVEARYRELDNRIASFEEYQSKQQVEAEVARLQAKYQDFNVQEVVTAALRTGSTDLEGTYKQIAFDRMVSRQNAERQVAEQKAQAEQAVVDAKRQAAVVSGGASATASTTSESFEPIRSVSEAWAAAKRQMNIP